MHHGIYLKYILVCVVLAGLFGAFGLRAQTQPATSTWDYVIPADATGRSKWSQQTIEDRSQRIVGLLVVLRGVADDPLEQIEHSRLWWAVYLAGEYRANECVPWLLEMIDKQFQSVRASFGRAEQDSIVIKSLAHIGKGSSEAAIEKLASDKSSKRAVCYLRVVYLVEGADVGKFMLQRAAEKQDDPDKKARLQKAVGLFADADKVVP